MNYQYTDRIIAYIDKWLIGRYSRLKSLVSFDDLNVLNEVNLLYREMYVTVKKAFLLLANQVYHDNLRSETTRTLDEEWLDALLYGYDPVSKYVFTHEIDRKRARLIESVIASNTKVQEIDSALRAMSFMCRMYADRVTDEAVMQAYNDEGEKFVRWVSEKDDRTCSVCRKRDGRIYEIRSAPADPHPNCRCRRERV